MNWLTKLFRRKARVEMYPGTGPLRVSAPTLREMGELPEVMTNYLAGLPIEGIRNDSLLDGLISGHERAGGGWTNHVTGMGTRQRDKVVQGQFEESVRITDPELSALYNGNDLAKRILETKPREMMRRGWVLTFPGQKMGVTPPPGAAKATPGKTAPEDAGGTDPEAKAQARPTDPKGQSTVSEPVAPEAAKKPQDLDPTLTQGKGTDKPYQAAGAQTAGEGESGPPAPAAVAIAVPGAVTKDAPEAGDQNSGADIAKAVEAYANALQVKPRVLESMIFGRTYGGGLLIMGLDDGQDVSEPLDEENIKSIKYLTWIDRRFIVAHTYYEEIGPMYGEVEIYNIINPFGNQKNTLVHESRVLRFDGAPVDLLMRRRLAGWTLSSLQACYDVMRQFDTSFQSVSQLMSDISQATMKIKGLAQMISSDPRTLQTRMTMVDMSRSSGRMIFLDADNEEFKREPTPLTGVSDTIEMQMLRMSAAAEMPVAILFGREPSGLNATGDADFRRFYDTIAGEQVQVLEPRLCRLYTLICLAKDGPTGGKMPDGGLEFVWHKLYAPSELEQSTIRWNMAQADDKYIANGTLLPEEVAMSRFRSGDLHLDTEIQGDLRREKLKTAQLAPSGAEKAKADADNKQKEFDLKSKAIDTKAAKPGTPPPGAKP
jgi:phage-related protein (TIGR01555 family)